MHSDYDICKVIDYIEQSRHSNQVIASMIDGFRLLGADHYVITGIPLPQHAIEDLIVAINWHDCRSGKPHRLRADDLVIQKAIDWPFSFVLRKRFHRESGLALAAGLADDHRELLVVPVVGIAKYQGVAALTFAREEDRSHFISEHCMRFSTRSLVVSLVHAGLSKLAEFGKLCIQRKGELTPREREVVALSALGKTAGEIAFALGINDRTVVTHLRNAALKLAAANKAECVLQAIRYHQIGPGAGRGFYEMTNEIFGVVDYDYREVF